MKMETSMNINRMKTMATKTRMTKTRMMKAIMTASKNKKKPRLKSLLTCLHP
jgi:hypothetical protein